MAVSVNREDYEFVMLSTKFCNKVEQFIEVLGLDKLAIESYKYDNELLQFFFNTADNYASCGESFTKFKIKNMRIAFSHLVHACKNSRKYNMNIGMELGIEVEVFAFHAN